MQSKRAEILTAISILVGGAIVIYLVLTAYAGVTTFQAQVKGFSWNRSISIWSFGPVIREGDSLPEGATEISHEVKDNSQWLGGSNFLFSKKTTYKYTVLDWAVIDIFPTQGEGKSPAPVWAPVPQFECQTKEVCHKATTSEVYTVLFTGNGTTYSLPVSYEKWLKYKEGDTVTLAKNFWNVYIPPES